MRLAGLKTSLAALLLLPLATAAQQPQPQQQSQKQAIYQLLTTRQYAQAESAARSYLAAAPTDCGVSVLLGLALRGQAKLDPAFKAFRTAARQCPQSLAAVEGAAETAFLLNNPEARELVTRVIQLRPGEETGYAMLGAIDARKGDCEGAVENYAKAPNRVRQSPLALRQYAVCLADTGHASEAVPLLTQLLTLQDDAPNRTALARAQFAAKDPVTALATLQPLLTPDSKNAAVFLLAAQLAEADNKTPQAVEWFRKAIELNPGNVNAYLSFSELSFNHGAFKVGTDFLTVGIHHLPSESRLYLARGVMEEQSGQMDAALADFQQAHHLDPQLSFAEDAMGMLFSQKNDAAAALTLFDRQSHLHPDDSLLQYLYAEAISQAAQTDNTQADDRQMDQAIAAARKAVRLEPAYQPARDLLCVLLLRRNDLDGVILQAQEAIRRDPWDETAIYQQLLAEHKLKHADKAAVLVKQLQEAKSHNRESRTKYLLEEAPTPISAPPP